MRDIARGAYLLLLFAKTVSRPKQTLNDFLGRFPMLTYIEHVQMRVRPTHGILDGHMQLPKSIRFGNLNSPPDFRVKLEEGDFKLADDLWCRHGALPLLKKDLV